MTRTLWVTNDFPPRSGGIEQFVANLLDGLPPAQTRVLASPGPGDSAFDRRLPYRVDRIARRPLLPTPALASALRAAVDEHAADVVAFGAAWPLGELAARVPRPTVALTHGHEAGMTKVGLGRLVRRAVAHVDALTVISGFTRRALAASIPDGVAVHHLPPGVDVERFCVGLDGRPVRERYGIPLDAPLVVCVSRLVRRKGQDLLLEAWPEVLAAVPGACLLIAGTGPLDSVLRRRAAALGLHTTVRFAGDVDHDDLPQYYAAGDVFAMPCRTRLGGLDVEGLGIVYLEAQACGRPVIAGASGGAPEAIHDGVSGWVVGGRSRTELADRIVTLLRDERLRGQMGSAGREFVERQYAWPVIRGRLREIIGSLH